MSWVELAAMLVWTGAGAALLAVLMFIDSLTTKYKDMSEIKKGNTAVTVRFIMKLLAQGYILASSITSANDLWQALLVSAVSFIILLILEIIVHKVLDAAFDLHLDEGVKNGQISHALLSGSLHVVGALIIAACL